ncbi:MAG: sulfite reductase subunit beta [Omnitrophica bacterium GWA2_50_21]|nr:MAG: sulfite reductase subunit beta [Omnitrophica bacterium GWA2_50_21]
MQKKISKVEEEKDNSRYLRGTIREQLAQDTPCFDDSVNNILKFHGIYQQDDRDFRQAQDRQGREKHFIFMVRMKIPGGKVTSDQYLKMDELSDRYGNGTLRVTTRQGIQFHGVIKKNLKETMRALNRELITTLGACGDIERNVVTCPAPLQDRAQAQVQQYARKISDQLLPKTKAYHEIWLNGEQAYSGEQAAEIEPLYGKTYLPRKFKTAIAFPGDNCVDVYTHDIGLVAITDEKGDLSGFNVLVGGGLGMTHRKPETHPLLAKPLGYVNKDKILPLAEGIVKVQRDHGNRENRMRARMKYLIEEKGIEWFYAAVKQQTGFDLEPMREMGWKETPDHLGWHEMGGGRFFCGIFVPNGRIQDGAGKKLKSGFKKLVETFNPEIRFTPQQNILFAGIPVSGKEEFEGILKDFSIRREAEISTIERWSMACPALPTCGLALTESERVLPGVIRELEGVLTTLGLAGEHITVRMTGCPNGCSRPYTGEIGLVGSGLNTYALFLGGNFDGTRLNHLVSERVKGDEIVRSLVSVFEAFKSARASGERFGDFCNRLGVQELQKLIEAQ